MDSNLALNSLVERDDIDKTSSVPLYRQLATSIIRKMDQGIIKQGDMLPGEIYISERLDLSRTTVRKTMEILEQESRIVRRRGKGTIVSTPKLKRSLNNMYNFSMEMRILGLQPKSKMISFSEVNPDHVVAEKLKVSTQELVYKIVRLRLADSKPLLLETAYVPVKFCPNLNKNDMGDSLYAKIIEYTGVLPHKAVETYEAILLKEKYANLLDCIPNSPAFRINRVSTNENSDIFEFTTILAPGDRNRYEITLQRNSDMFLSRKL